ncbi:arf-GAP with Rho-GAP domain, ANK repeat and PH domain-containing protein 1-like isoform X4 [Alosa sapidissima]|uniref:arf-GAP with Rho-GAP domain, ANK repeat and PH domain-containing protein 1-like isoform X4 n=1 Tax=Alosa sapidissima TaxID=34773 RepID=UPI001C0859A1|nr:arf-GAP with Rho-GAP domain, ANK repeat and PH domain-containing protein 1-like isoform X4 [Alosa sapidissima]
MSLWSSALPVSDWLAALRLEQYSAVFQDSGLVAVGDCVHLSNEQLEQMGVSLPGHRKRILGNLPCGRDGGGGRGGEAEEEEQGTMPIPKSRTKFCHTPAHTPAQTLQAPSEAPPIPPRLTYSQPPQCFSMATVTTATALEKPTPSPRPRLPKSPKKDAPTPNQHQPSAAPPSLPLSLSPFPPPSLPPSLSPLSPSLPPSLSPLSLSLSLSLPPSLPSSPSLFSSSPSLPCPPPASDLHLYEQCSLGQLPPLPPKSYPVGAALAGSLAPPVPRRPPAPPLRPPRTPPGNSSALVHDPTEPPSGPGIPPRNRLPTTAPKRRVPPPPANSRSLSTDSSDDYEEPDLTNSQEPLDMADKDGFLSVPQPKIRYSCLYSDDELLDDDDDPSTPTRSWQDYGLSTLPSSGSVYLPPSGRLATTPPVDDPASSLSTVIKMGWLDKNPPQGARIFQKRWVKLDSEYLRYFDNDKEVYSKRIIPTCCITEVMCVGDQKFEVVTHNRTFLFRADNDLERTEWVRVLQEVMSPQQGYELTFNPTLTPDMQGYLELRGLRSKLYTVVSADKLFLYKNQEDYKLGIGITSIEMNVGNIKDTDRRAFDLTTPYRIFSFVADSEQLKERWVCVLRESIAAALSHSEVAERIWAEPSNALCADCSAPHPEWASINLCVCVCKRCAGEHRSLGPSISKVRSLKMDRKVWTEELIQVFLLLGNERANQFWAANVPPSEALSACSSSEERRRFITAKYRQGKYRRYHPLYGNQQELDNALSVNVQSDDLLETLSLIFCGADVNCCRGDADSPLLLAETCGRTLQLELLTHNRNTEIPRLEVGGHMDTVHYMAPPSITHNGFLFKTGSMARPITERKAKEEFSRRWCVLNDGVFSYYESDKAATPNGGLKMKEIVCLAVNPPEKHGYDHTFELYSDAERLYLFGQDNIDVVREWVKSIAKSFIPACAESFLQRDFERVGRLRYKDSLHLQTPRLGWFCLEGSALHVCLENRPEETIHLHKLKELSIQQDNEVLVLVERGRSLYVEGERKLDFAGWSQAIQRAAGSCGDSLGQQQLTETDIPVIVERCITYITQCGLTSEGIYRKSGVNSRVASLLEAFRQDARSVWLKEGEQQLDDVANVLKRFFRDLNDGLFTTHTSQHWLNTTALCDDVSKISKYQQLFSGLPRVNKATLCALVNHLYCVQCFADKNQMNLHNLAIVFGPTLFQTDGKDYNAGRVIEDLIQHYISIFSVDELQLKKQLDEMTLIIDLRDKLKPAPPGGHFICTVYLEEKKESAEQLVKIPATMSASELVCEILDRRKISVRDKDYWCCFQINEKEETERPLHFQERVLPIVHSLGTESHLLVKKHYSMEAMLVFLASKVDVAKHGMMRFREERSLLGLTTGSFNERYFILTPTSLRLYKEVRSNRAEREWPVKCLKVYLGIKKKLRPPTCWGLTVIYESDKPDKQERQQWYLCCDTQTELREWFATFLSIQHEGSVWPAEGCKMRSSRSVVSEARLGNVSLIPLRGNESDIRNSVAAFTADALALFKNT